MRRAGFFGGSVGQWAVVSGQWGSGAVGQGVRGARWGLGGAQTSRADGQDLRVGPFDLVPGFDGGGGLAGKGAEFLGLGGLELLELVDGGLAVGRGARLFGAGDAVLGGLEFLLEFLDNGLELLEGGFTEEGFAVLEGDGGGARDDAVHGGGGGLGDGGIDGGSRGSGGVGDAGDGAGEVELEGGLPVWADAREDLGARALGDDEPEVGGLALGGVEGFDPGLGGSLEGGFAALVLLVDADLAVAGLGESGGQGLQAEGETSEVGGGVGGAEKGEEAEVDGGGQAVEDGSGAGGEGDGAFGVRGRGWGGGRGGATEPEAASGEADGEGEEGDEEGRSHGGGVWQRGWGQARESCGAGGRGKATKGKDQAIPG